MNLFRQLIDRRVARPVTLVGYGDFEVAVVSDASHLAALAEICGSWPGSHPEHYCEARLVPLGLAEDARVAVQIEGRRIGYMRDDAARQLQEWLGGFADLLQPRCVALIAPGEIDGERLEARLDVSLPPQIMREGAAPLPFPEKPRDAHI